MKKKTHGPPPLASWLLKRLVPFDERLSVAGDFREIHDDLVRDLGPRRARFWYWSQTLRSMPMFARTQFNWSTAMLGNYLTIAWRNIKKQKIYSLITISGLVLGLAVFLVFAQFSDFELHFDGQHLNRDSIYAVVQVIPGGRDGESRTALTPAPLVPALAAEFPEIEAGVRYFSPGQTIVRSRDNIFYERGIRFVDPGFLSMFTFDLETGDGKTALSRPLSVVLTRRIATKYFGSRNPMGETLTLDNRIDLVVTGIAADVPLDSSLRFDFLVPFETAEILEGPFKNWTQQRVGALLKLGEGRSPDGLEAGFPGFIRKYYPASPDAPRRLQLHPLRDFHLNSEGIETFWGNAQANFVVLWVVAVLLLLIACFNFMNLSTARSLTRAREVGLRKVVGARRGQLVKQFMGEAMLMSLISLPLALALYELLRPLFSAEFGGALTRSLAAHPRVLLLAVGVTVLTGFIAGSYPAFFISRYSPLQILRGRIQSGRKSPVLRKVLVVAQFTFSVLLVLMTLISVQQTRFMFGLDLGYDRTSILTVRISGAAQDKLEVFKKELAGHKEITAVSAAAGLPIEWETRRRVIPEGFGEEEGLSMNAYAVDYGFVEMLGLKMLEGRAFSREFSDRDGFILNRTAVERLGWRDPVGKRLKMGEREGPVIGVARDFHFMSLFFEGMRPAVLFLGENELNFMLVKYASRDGRAAVEEFVRERWSAVAPDLPFVHLTLEEAFQDMTSGDKTAGMTGILGGLAILLSCLGLYGLSSYSVERRTREIGIRKVLGASSEKIVRLLSRGFLKLVVIADLIAIPVAYFIMYQLLHFLYAYPMSIGAGVFILIPALSLLLAFLVVSSQTWKSAMANPAVSLKYE